MHEAISTAPRYVTGSWCTLGAPHTQTYTCTRAATHLALLRYCMRSLPAGVATIVVLESLCCASLAGTV